MKYWYVDVSLIVLGLGAIALVHVMRWNEAMTFQHERASLRADVVASGVVHGRDGAACRFVDGAQSYALVGVTEPPACASVADARDQSSGRK